MIEETKEKLSKTTARAKVVFDESLVKAKVMVAEAMVKGKTVWSEIRTNFKAADGVVGIRKYQSMFMNLWKSGGTGRAVLIVSVVVIFGLVWLCFGGIGKYERLLRDSYEIAGELCELDNLLGKQLSIDGGFESFEVWLKYGFTLPVDRECEIREAVNKYKSASSDEKATKRLAAQGAVDDMKKLIVKKRDEYVKERDEIKSRYAFKADMPSLPGDCSGEDKRRPMFGVDPLPDDSSPFGVAKQFLSYVQAGKFMRATSCFQGKEKWIVRFFALQLSWHDVFLPEPLEKVKARLQKTKYKIVSVVKNEVEIKVNGKSYSLEFVVSDGKWCIDCDSSSLLSYILDVN